MAVLVPDVDVLAGEAVHVGRHDAVQRPAGLQGGGTHLRLKQVEHGKAPLVQMVLPETGHEALGLVLVMAAVGLLGLLAAPPDLVLRLRGQSDLRSGLLVVGANGHEFPLRLWWNVQTTLCSLVNYILTHKYNHVNSR